MAAPDSTALTYKQLMVALEEIAHLAKNVDHGFYSAESDCSEPSLMAARHMANQIGAIADRCHGFSIYGFDEWLLPPAFGWESLKAIQAKSSEGA